jgi:hypothetical protein
MKRALLDAWIDALESGKYKQCRATLRKGDGYCCLGVLCVVAREPFEPDEAVLPERFAEENKISRDGWPLAADADSLVGLNDSGATFTEIAALLREHHRQYIREIEP